MRKVLSLLCLLCSLHMMAEKAVVLRVELKDGTTNDYLLAERPKITFETGSTVFLCQDITTTYAEADLKRFLFVTGETAVSSLRGGDTRTYYDGNTLTVQGLTDPHLVSIYAIDGTLRQVPVSLTNGGLQLSMGTMPTGHYIIKIGNKQTIKILRK